MVERERGAVAVEFALVFVLLMSMLFVLIEGAIIFMHQASVSAAAREGVRMLAITGDEGKAASAAADAYPFGTLTSIVPTGTCAMPPDRSVTVKMTVTATPDFTLGFFGPQPLTGKGAMRCGG